MIDAQFGLDPLAPYLATIFALVALGSALFVAGRPSDIASERWPVWIVTALSVLGLIYFLTRSLNMLDYRSCDETSEEIC